MYIHIVSDVELRSVFHEDYNGPTASDVPCLKWVYALPAKFAGWKRHQFFCNIQTYLKFQVENHILFLSIAWYTPLYPPVKNPHVFVGDFQVPQQQVTVHPFVGDVLQCSTLVELETLVPRWRCSGAIGNWAFEPKLRYFPCLGKHTDIMIKWNDTYYLSCIYLYIYIISITLCCVPIWLREREMIAK